MLYATLCDGLISSRLYRSNADRYFQKFVREEFKKNVEISTLSLTPPPPTPGHKVRNKNKLPSKVQKGVTVTSIGIT